MFCPLTLGCYTSCCHLVRRLAPANHMLLSPNAVRVMLADTFALQLYMQKHSKLIGAYAFSGGLRGGPVQSAYIPVAAMLFGHVCTIDLVDLLPCCCYTSAVQLAMTSLLGQVFLHCLRGQATLPAQSDLPSMFCLFRELVLGGWSIGTRPAESAVFV